jgi:ferredoxin-nitrite reductase
MWLLEEKGLDWFRAQVEAVLLRRGGSKLRPAAPLPTDAYSRRDLMGVHPQKQEGKSWVGVTVPVGRLSVLEMRQLADLADKYSAGEIRLTVEQNAILPNVDNARVPELLAEPALQPGNRLRVEQQLSLMRGLVSCTGSEFCGQGLVETKHRAVRVAERLDAELELSRLVRVHWTGCPNSCGQAQVGDIGLMGSPAKKLDEATGNMMGVEVGARARAGRLARAYQRRARLLLSAARAALRC